MKQFLYIVLYVDIAVMILSVLIQSRGVGLSATFGGEGGVFRKKRGVEKILHIVSIVSAVGFLLLTLLLPFYDSIVDFIG